MKKATILLQFVVKAWLTARFDSYSQHCTLASTLASTNGTTDIVILFSSPLCKPFFRANIYTSDENVKQSGIYDKYLSFFIERQKFYRTRKAVILIQRFVRAWIQRKHHKVKFTNSKIDASEIPGDILFSSPRCQITRPINVIALDDIEELSSIGEGNKTSEIQWRAATKIQEHWKIFVHNMHSKRCFSAIKIQSQWRCWSIRKNYLCQVEAIRIIQSAFVSSMNHKVFHEKRIAAIEIQRFIRGHLARTKLLGILESKL